MKNFLIPIIILFFIGCGTVKSSTSDNNGSTIVSESNQTNIENNNSSIAPENNQTAIENNNSTEEESNNSLTSIDDIKDYLARSNSNYQLTPINNISEENIKTYINNDSDYNIKQLGHKRDYNSNIEIFYDGNKSKIIPKYKVYIVENSNKTQIFVTFNLDGNYSKVENATALLIYHNTSNQPTGFTNIKTTDSLNIYSLIEILEKAFNQVGINNLEVNNTTIIYHTAPKNSGKVFQCSVNGTPEAVSITIDSNGKTNLNSELSPDMNISCSLDRNGSNSILLSDIIKLDFNDTTISQSPTPTPTVEPTPTSIPPSIYDNPNNSNNNYLNQTEITLKKRPDNSISHQAIITVDIENENIESNKLKVTGIITESNSRYSKNKYISNENIGTGIKSFIFKDIPINLADERVFTLSFRIENIETGESIIKNTGIIVRIFGNFYGETADSQNENKFTEKDIKIKSWENNIINQATYKLSITMAIDKKGKYKIELFLYFNGKVVKFRAKNDNTREKVIDGNNIKKDFKENFTLEYLQINEITPYEPELKITKIDTNEVVTIKGDAFYNQ